MTNHQVAEPIRLNGRPRSVLFALVVAAVSAVVAPGAARAADVLDDGFIAVREGNQANAKIGFAVATAGDVNGDGHSDVLLQGSEGNGTVWCYHGAPAGIAAAPSWTITGSQPNEMLGVRPAPAGDVNGDGYGDVIIGTPLYTNEQFFEGAARVYLGSDSGLAATPQITLESNVANGTLGGSVDAAGDVNGDGFDDIIVGWSKYSDGQSFEGRALVYPGSPGGVQPTAIWSFESNIAQAGFGARVSGAGDINADGFDDVLVSAPDLANGQLTEGRVYLFLGSAGGPALTPSWSYESNIAGGRCGWGLGQAGDVNADGYSDIVFDTGTNNPATGAALVFLGSPGGLNAAADRTFPSTSGAFGDAIYTAGDVNGDGCADIVAGDMSTSSLTGRIVILGGAETSASLPLLATRGGQTPGEEFGIDARPAGDVNGDGFGDVIVGAPFYDNGETDEGVVRIYLGRPSLPSGAFFLPTGPEPGADFGSSVAQGDWNADGFGDLAVGIPGYDADGADRGRVHVYYGGESGYPANPDWWTNGSTASGRYGHAIANAGDVDNDGDDELIIGEPFSGPAVNDDFGRAVLFLGSPDGLQTSSWAVNGPIPQGCYGFSVAGGSDVNGDGYGDVLVGAPFTQGSTLHGGTAFVYLGSANGLSLSHAWSGQGGQGGDEFGRSVAGLGDVNGDGFGDIAIGAPGKESEAPEAEEGFVYVYRGAAGGVLSEHWHVEGNQAGAAYGFKVAAAGDVDGDGLCDLLQGAPGYDLGMGNMGVDCGTAEVYLGSTLEAPVLGWQRWGNARDDRLGEAVAGGGDVNNDGYSDVLVGAPYQNGGASDDVEVGAVYLHLGGPTGVHLQTDWSQFPGDLSSRYGAAVSMSADATGDGFDDFVVGQPGFTGETGQAWFYYGSRENLTTETSGVLKSPRQFRSDGTTPIALGGMSDDGDSFALSALARSAKGRSDVRTEYQVAAGGSGWTGSPLAGPSIDTGTPQPGIGSATPALVSVTGMNPNTPYHWRVRFAGDSPFFPHTPWLSMPGNGAGAADLRTRTVPTGVGGGDGRVADAATPLGPRVGPNPCRDEATIRFSMPEAGRARITVHDVSGRRVATIADQVLAAGEQALTWDTRDHAGRRVAAGMYLLRLERGSTSAATKVIVRR